MVCDRCIAAVEKEVSSHGLEIKTIKLGEVDLGDVTVEQAKLQSIESNLKLLGFELIDNKRQRLADQIKTFIIEQVHYKGRQEPVKLSVLLSEEFHYEYNYLSNLFSSVEGITIEHYHIQQRIEKTKELIDYDELTLSEIAHELGYSSAAHLSSQFKKLTGITPTQYKEQKTSPDRKPIDKL
jgi:AraC-like DNA-binding protein